MDIVDIVGFRFGNKRKSPRRKGPNIKVCKTWEEVMEIYRA